MKKTKALRPAAEKGALPAWGWYALCFALPCLVMLCVYATQGFYPFGDRSILVSDLAQQYVEFFCALKRGDLFFSWSKSLGTSYIGVFSYYVSSPFSLITLLVPNESMPLCLMVITLLKVGLIGLAYAIFARHYFDRLGLPTLLCALGYALCAYCVGYALCIMWLDGLIWLPIILLGLEWLMDGKRRWLFPASLAICFFSTWYISYMIGGFCCLWFLFRAVSKELKGKAILLAVRDFLLSALWALCLTAWLWVPSFLTMMSGKFSSDTGDYAGLVNFDLMELLPQFFPGHHQFFSNGALPCVFCGTLTLLAAVAYFFLKRIPLRQRLAAAGVALALILSLWLSPLDKIWHLFRYPIWFPHRYAFLLSFLLCFLALHTYHRVADTFRLSRCAALLLVALLCWEMGANATNIFQTIDQGEAYQSYAAYQEDYRANAALVSAAQADGDQPFYRMGATYDRGLNGPLTFGYRGITHYSSLYNHHVNTTLKNLGFAQTSAWCAYYGSTHFTDALFDIRYVITDRPVPGYREVAQSGTLGLYENPNTLPLAFLPDITPAGISGASSALKQNLLFTALTGDGEGLFTPASCQADSYDGYTVLTYEGNGQPIYLDLTSTAVTDLQLDGRSLLRYPTHTSKTRCLHCLGAPAQGENLSVVVVHNGDWDPANQSFTLDQDRLARGVEALRVNTQVEKVTNSRVTLTAHADATRTLATTIPAENGWTAYVDGKKVPLSSWLDDTFLCLDLPAGTHQVTLRYTVPGLIPGLVLTLLAALSALGLWFLGRKAAGADAEADGPRPARAEEQAPATDEETVRHSMRPLQGRILAWLGRRAKSHLLMAAGCVVLTLITLCVLRCGYRSLFHANSYLSLALYAVLLYGLYRLTRTYAAVLSRRFAAVVGVSALVFLAGQLIFAAELRFIPSWDVSALFDGAISWATRGSLTDLVSDTTDGATYFYHFPNNLGGAAVLAAVFKLCSLVGATDYFWDATVFNALLIAATFATVALAGRRMATLATGEDGGAWGVFFGGVFLLYPPFWFGAAVIYTDFLSILFPVLALWLYYEALSVPGKRRYLFYALAGLSIGLGCLIRATVAIVLIAVALCLLLDRKWLDAAAFTALATAGVLLFQLLLNLAVYPSQLDREKKEVMATPVTHWVMMSIYPGGNGGLTSNDYAFTRSFDDPHERDAAIAREIRARLETMGPKGVRELAGRKLQVTFGDGTLMLHDILDDRPQTPGALHDFLLSGGPRHETYQTLCDAIFLIWLALAVVLCLCGILEPLPAACYAPTVSVVGFALFYLAWETRGRYVTSFAPLILLSAMAGFLQLTRRVRVTRRVPPATQVEKAKRGKAAKRRK